MIGKVVCIWLYVCLVRLLYFLWCFAFFVDVISIIKKENIKICCIRLIEDVIVIGTWTYLIFKYISVN